MTRDEVRALAFVAFLVGLSALVRLRSDPADVSLLAEDVPVEALAEDSEAALEEAEARARPLAEGETLDPNRAPAVQLDRLPGVGPATAERIVAARDSAPFPTPEDLLGVRGIGPATLEKMRPYLDPGAFAGAASRDRRGAARAGGSGPAARAGAGRADVAPGGGRPDVASARPETPAERAAPALVDVNRAGAAELQELTGIGPALAARLIAHRDSAGPFRSAEDLLAVRGIGPATLERIRGRIRMR